MLAVANFRNDEGLRKEWALITVSHKFIPLSRDWIKGKGDRTASQSIVIALFD